MKIIKIEFSNINNLKGGPHTINFDSPPLDTAGLFAIIGPTGSGKSTILDVITLALFNRIPRFNSAITKNEVFNLGSVLTHHTQTGMASLTYEVKGKRFTSTWNIDTARTGNLKDHYMTIHDSFGNIIAEKSEVPSKNEQIIGLKYEQFTKAIILSQGEFSKFLKAGKNERGQLLEDLTGLQIYRTLGKASFQKQKELKLNYNFEKERLESIRLLDSEELEKVNEQISAFTSSNKTLEVEIQKLNEIIQFKKQIKSISDEINAKDIAHKEILQSLEQNADKYNKLHLHDKISHLKGDVSLFQNEQKNVEVAKNSVAVFQNNLTDLSQSIKDQLIYISEVTNQPSEISNYQKNLSRFEKEIAAYDNSISNLNSKGGETRERINHNAYTSKIKLSNRVSPANALDILQERIQTLNPLIEASELNEQTNIEKVKKDLVTKKLQLNQLKELEREEITLQKLTKAQTEEHDKIKNNALIIDAKKPLADKSEQNLTILKNNEKLLTQNKEDAIKIASLSERRSNLVTGEPCPLCGSLEHPYAAHLPGNNISKIEAEIETVSQQIREENKFLDELKEVLVQAKTNVSHGKEFVLKNKKLIDNLNQEIAKIKDQLASLSLAEDGVTLVTENILELDSQIQKKELGIDAIQEKKINEKLQKEYADLDQILTKYNQQKVERNKKFEGKNVSETCNELSDKMSALILSKKELESKLEITQSSLQKSNSEIRKLNDRLLPKIQDLGFKTITEVAENFLSEEVYQKLKKDFEDKKEQKQTLEIQIKDLQTKLLKLKEKDKSPEKSLTSIETLQRDKTLKRDQENVERGKLLEALKNDEKAQKEKAQKEIRLNILENELNRWTDLNHVIGDSKGNTFSNFAQGLTLQNLLVFTNIRLQKLTDRYLLDKPVNDGLLTVVDRYQADTVRAVSTLSGGETFLISLALALSLSDMASQNVTIDSLFIDEGFGTLDQETLEIAMDTLEKLQSESQKTVGIISHIEALKERINVQIRLEKNALGYSKIEISD